MLKHPLSFSYCVLPLPSYPWCLPQLPTEKMMSRDHENVLRLVAVVLNHPINSAQSHAAAAAGAAQLVEDGEEPALVMEYCHFKSLKSQLDVCRELFNRHSNSNSSRNQPFGQLQRFTLQLAGRLLLQAAEGMVSLHNQSLEQQQQQQPVPYYQQQQQQAQSHLELVQLNNELMLQATAAAGTCNPRSSGSSTSGKLPAVLHNDFRADNLMVAGDPKNPDTWTVKVCYLALS
jgi:serine/threonine protein kinase